MRIVTLPGRAPQVDSSAWVAPTATLIGSVIVEAEANIWYDVVIRADRDTITIGPGCNLQDGTVAHTNPGMPLVLGRDVSVGHNVILHGCVIEDGVLIGMGVTVLNRAVIGAGSIVAAGAVVPEGAVIPPNSMVMGLPGKVRRELTADEAGRGRRTAVLYRELADVHRQGVLTQE